MVTHDIWSTVTILIGGIATLAIFTFLFKENPLYRFFEHVFIGIAAGLGTILVLKNFLWPEIIVPLLGLNIVRYPDGTTSQEYNPFNLLYLIAMLFGLLYYASYSKRYGWLAKLVVGFSLGMSGGIALKGFFNEWIPQIASSMKPLVVFNCTPENVCALNYLMSLQNCVFVFTLLSVMYYFFFSFKREGVLSKGFATSGRWLMMVCFGAFFGSTVMARMALLVERIQFLMIDWRQTVVGLFGV